MKFFKNEIFVILSNIFQRITYDLFCGESERTKGDFDWHEVGVMMHILCLTTLLHDISRPQFTLTRRFFSWRISGIVHNKHPTKQCFFSSCELDRTEIHTDFKHHSHNFLDAGYVFNTRIVSIIFDESELR